MKLYAVRLTETHEAVGILAARDKCELFWLIDEVTDPTECEVKGIKSGGLLWPKKTNLRFPFEEDDDDPVFSEPTFSETVEETLEDPTGWKAVNGAWGYPESKVEHIG